MKKALVILFILVLCGSTIVKAGEHFLNHVFNDRGYGNYKDDDWSLTYYANARLPSKNSLTWVTEENNKFLRFSLNDKDKGFSKSDRKFRDGAPYWERAELKQRTGFKENAKYEIKFNVRFIEGFVGNRETFWQFHSWTKECSTFPPIMFKIDKGYLTLQYKVHPKVFTSINYQTEIFLPKLIGKWNNFRILLDTNKKIFSVYLNEELIRTDTTYAKKSCGVLHTKFGIYRPGNEFEKNKLSVVDFDKIQITEIK